jgi:hypothetical protein
MPLAIKGVPSQEQAVLPMRALVAQAQANLAGSARLHKVVFDKAFLAGTDLWWLDQQGLRFVVPAKDHMAVTAEARAPAATGEEIIGAPCAYGVSWAGPSGVERTAGDGGRRDHQA